MDNEPQSLKDLEDQIKNAQPGQEEYLNYLDLSPEAQQGLTKFKKAVSQLADLTKEFSKKMNRSLWPGNRGASWPDSIASIHNKSIADIDRESCQHYSKVFDDKGIQALIEVDRYLTKQIELASNELDRLIDQDEDIRPDNPFSTIQLVYTLRLNALRRFTRTYFLTLSKPESKSQPDITTEEPSVIDLLTHSFNISGGAAHHFLIANRVFEEYPDVSGFKEFEEIVESEDFEFQVYSKTAIRTMRRSLKRIFGTEKGWKSFMEFKMKVKAVVQKLRET